MDYLALDLDSGDLILRDNSVWKSLHTWLNGGTLYSDYYDASNCGDYWGNPAYWINIDSNSTYLTFTIEYEFVNAVATYSSLCQIRFDELAYGGVTVTADTTGLSILTPATSKYINCDYSNANIKIDITANLLTKEITTYIHKDYAPLVKAVSSSNYSFTKFLIQAGSKEYDVYRLPTTTKLLNVSVSDDAVSYPNFSERELNYVNKRGLAEIWTNIKNWVLAHIGNGTLTIQKNGTDVTTFSANSSSNATANITVPTKVSDLTNDSGFLTTANIPSKTSDLTNDSGFLTSHQSLANYVTLDGAETISGNKTFTGTLTGDITGNCSGSSGSCTGNAATATQFSANKAVTLTGDVTGTASSKAGWSVATTLANSGVTAGSYGPSADVTGNNNSTISVPQITVDAKGRVTSVVNRTLTCKNNTYNVYNKTLTIQKNGTNVATFTSNSNTDVTANITVPTKVSELTNDSGFLTSHQSLSNYVTLNGAQTISATKSFSTNITTASTSTSQRETWGIAFTKTDANGGGASALGVVQGKNSNDFYSILRLSNPRGSNKPAAGSGVNTGNCWGGIGVYFNFALNRGYPYAPNCDRWADSSNSDFELAATSWVRRYCETTKGFLTSHQSLSNYSTLANTVKSLSISGKTITVTPGSGSAYTLTTQDTVYTHPTSAGNKHIPSGGSSGQYLKYSSSGTATWANLPSFTGAFSKVTSKNLTGVNITSDQTLTATVVNNQLVLITVDLTTSTGLCKITCNNIFALGLHTLVGTNSYKQDSVNYGCFINQTSVGRTRAVLLAHPYNSSITLTITFNSYSPMPSVTNLDLTVYQ